MDGVEETVPEEEGAVGGVDIEIQDTEPLAPPSGKVVGRSRRKAQVATKYEVPVELHVPVENGRQVLHKGNVSPYSPGGDLSPGRSPYENLNRQNPNEHAYEGTRMGPPRSPRSPRGRDPTYEEMNISRQYKQQHSPVGAPSPQAPSGVRSPSTPTMLHLSRTPGAQTSRHSPVSPSQPPYRSQSPRTPVLHSPARTSTSPGSQEHFRSDDRYNTDRTESSRPSTKTYLTDDMDDGGFSERNSRLPKHDRYNNNDSNRRTDDRYRQNERESYDPSDRYNDRSKDYSNRNLQQRLNVDSKGNHLQTGQPVPAPRGFHRQQGSGRSDTSASDSGFGEIDYAPVSSKYQSNGYHGSGYGSGGNQSEFKTPYYNHAFEHDHEHEDASTNDIMAKHKALAAKMMHANNGVRNSGSRYDCTDRYNDPNYTRELKKWRENINSLEETGGAVDTRGERFRVPSDSQQMEESFI